MNFIVRVFELVQSFAMRHPVSYVNARVSNSGLDSSIANSSFLAPYIIAIVAEDYYLSFLTPVFPLQTAFLIEHIRD